jgi:hypothetical protein
MFPNTAAKKNPESACKNPAHRGKTIISICTNPLCLNRLCCVSCISAEHKECKQPNFPIEDICGRSYAALDNWPSSEVIRNYLLKHEREDNTLNQETINSINNDFQILRNNLLQLLDSELLRLKQLVIDKIGPSDSHPTSLKIREIYDLNPIATILEGFKIGTLPQSDAKIQIDGIFSNIAKSEVLLSMKCRDMLNKSGLKKETFLQSCKDIYMKLHEKLENFYTEKLTAYSTVPVSKIDQFQNPESVHETLEQMQSFSPTSPIISSPLQMSKQNNISQPVVTVSQEVNLLDDVDKKGTLQSTASLVEDAVPVGVPYVISESYPISNKIVATGYINGSNTVNGEKGSKKQNNTESLWTIKPERLEIYEKYYEGFDKIRKGFIANSEAFKIFQQSGLGKETLFNIWSSCDTGSRGYLDRGEFVMAMHLIALAKTKTNIEPVLPEELKKFLFNYKTKQPPKDSFLMSYQQFVKTDS